MSATKCPMTFSGQHQFLPRKYLRREPEDQRKSADPLMKENWYEQIACICGVVPTNRERSEMDAGLEATREEQRRQRTASIPRRTTEQQPGLPL